MQDAANWTPDEKQLAGDLHRLRRCLDDAVPRLTAVPELVKVAEWLRPNDEGLARVLSTVRLAIASLPDSRKSTASALYGLTPRSEGLRVRERREQAIAEYEALFGTRPKYEAFRTGVERILITDLAKVLVQLIRESRTAPPSASVRSGMHHKRRVDDELASQVIDFIDNLVSPRLRLLSSQVESTCDWLYEELIGYLVDALAEQVIEYLSSTELGPAHLEPRRDGAHATRIVCHQASFIVSAGTRPARPYEVEVALSDTADARLTSAQQLVLSNEGRLVLVSFAVAPALTPIESIIAEKIRAILDAGDRAIEAFVVSQLAFDTTGAVARLYGLVRRCFTHELRETIRLFILDPRSGGGMHLDERASHETQQSLRADFGVDGLGPAEKLLRLAVARFPTSESVAAEIVPSMQTVVRSPLRIPSARSVGAIQSELFGSDLVLQPLLNSDHLWIEAGYPAALRSEIEPVLDRHRSTLAELARELDFGPALREPTGEAFDIAAARQRRLELFHKTFGHLIAGYPSAT
jgi:hypothetical protein